MKDLNIKIYWRQYFIVFRSLWQDSETIKKKINIYYYIKIWNFAMLKKNSK